MVVSKTATIQSVNPATKEVVGESPIMTATDVAEAVSKAWSTYDRWQLTDLHARAKKMLTMHKLLEARADEIAQLVSTEVGKPLTEALLSELSGPLETCVWLADNADRLLKDQSIQLTNPMMSTKQTLLGFEPLGVIGVISPWNYPFSIPMMTVLMAVMVGNTVVLKPSEKSTLTGIKVAELFKDAGFPDGVVQVVTGDRSTGELLTKSKISKLVFTGSVIGGSQVMASCASNVVPCSLELGGKDAAIVMPDAPVDWTANGIVWGAFTNAGQACASIERLILIRGKNTDKLIETIVEKTRQLKLGVATDPLTDVGPLIDERQLSTVDEHVRQAELLGAKLLCGGKRRDDLGGFFFEPTVLSDVNEKMDIVTRETFGPVLPIIVVENEDQAVEKANDSEFGLCASVWGKNLNRAEAIARDLNVGTVLINDVLVSHACPQVPWGGMKKSGFGRSHSSFGLMDLVNIKHISIDGAGGSNRVWWYPYGMPKIKTARAGLKFLHGTFPFGRVKGLFGFLGNMFVDPKSPSEQQKKS